MVNQTDAIYLFHRARYCLAPPGDSLTRKSLFDSLLAGCVPVVFIRASLTQYDWHLSREDFEKVAVYIPMKDMLQSKANFLERLESIKESELIQKQEYIAEIAARLQYSVVRREHCKEILCLTMDYRCPMMSSDEIRRMQK